MHKTIRDYYAVIDQTSGFVTKKLIAVPMLARDKLIGVLEAVNTH
jgi:hypothetical protein